MSATVKKVKSGCGAESHFTFPLIIEGTHIDTGYNFVMGRNGSGNYVVNGSSELVTVNSMKEMGEELQTMERLYGEAFIFEPVPLDVYIH